MVTRPSLSLLKQIMADTPRLSALISEQFRTSQVEYLPPVEPLRRLSLAIGLLKMWPNLRPRSVHLRQPVLTRLGVVLTTDPPLLPDLEVPLEVQ